MTVKEFNVQLALGSLSSATKIRLATNPNTPTTILVKLSKDKNWMVRCGGAVNPNTPVKMLTKLSKDSIADVRWHVARNPSTLVEVLIRLSRDENYSVRYYTAHNPNTPKELKKWYKHNPTIL